MPRLYSKLPVEIRFWPKVDKQGPRFGRLGRCYDWTGAKNEHGYGIITIDGQAVRAHVWLWERKHGPVPDGLELDHLCRRPVCIRDSHLEAVTHKVNMERGGNAIKTHCPAGHLLSGDNLVASRLPRARVCRTCSNKRQRQYDRRRAA